ncbi:hypothetical protein SHELI_v1c03190 [Spiroplasma helicoides]|uniref:Uncharacterized protein n=1 Tax=Spiroplasma helicoides TaxID=216938 RepID=A0A1B3SK11_9MOLU|nr:hypothetical protein [Spiroplasma helicoides]AOG60274.1 hypothetical protein SHELI_v1c03190 [Spiroplasma helicoides]
MAKVVRKESEKDFIIISEKTKARIRGLIEKRLTAQTIALFAQEYETYEPKIRSEIIDFIVFLLEKEEEIILEVENKNIDDRDSLSIEKRKVDFMEKQSNIKKIQEALKWTPPERNMFYDIPQESKKNVNIGTIAKKNSQKNGIQIKRPELPEQPSYQLRASKIAKNEEPTLKQKELNKAIEEFEANASSLKTKLPSKPKPSKKVSKMDSILREAQIREQEALAEQLRREKGLVKDKQKELAKQAAKEQKEKETLIAKEQKQMEKEAKIKKMEEKKEAKKAKEVVIEKENKLQKMLREAQLREDRLEAEAKAKKELEAKLAKEKAEELEREKKAKEEAKIQAKLAREKAAKEKAAKEKSLKSVNKEKQVSSKAKSTTTKEEVKAPVQTSRNYEKEQAEKEKLWKELYGKSRTATESTKRPATSSFSSSPKNVDKTPSISYEQLSDFRLYGKVYPIGELTDPKNKMYVFWNGIKTKYRVSNVSVWLKDKSNFFNWWIFKKRLKAEKRVNKTSMKFNQKQKPSSQKEANNNSIETTED